MFLLTWASPSFYARIIYESMQAFASDNSYTHLDTRKLTYGQTNTSAQHSTFYGIQNPQYAYTITVT